MIQESLANVRKHAHASRVTVSFHKADRQIHILVADDGVGFDPRSLPPGQSSFGLGVMQERAGQVGGVVRIDSAPGRGTTVGVTIPRLAGAGRPAALADHVTAEADSDSRIRILLADDHALFLEGLQNLLAPKGFTVVGTARDGLEALDKARLLHPEMILMDLQMPRCNGLTATRLIKAEMPEIRIVILTMSDREQDLFQAIKSGAAGYLLKGLRAEELIDQLRGLASGAVTLSPDLAGQILTELNQREAEPAAVEAVTVAPEAVLSQKQIEILALAATGLTYKEIAARLFLSERAIKYHMAEILRELHFQTRRQAIVYARQAGLGKKAINGS
ncbi:MAG: response regulator [Bacteroidota bacterium]